MKFCQPHWDALRAEIDSAGLGQFVSKDGAEAIAKTVASIGNAAVDVVDGASQFDPLMAAHWAIVNNTMDLVGLRLMMPNEDGSHKCPLCFIREDHKACCSLAGCKIETFDHWIGFAVADQVKHAKKLGLMGDT